MSNVESFVLAILFIASLLLAFYLLAPMGIDLLDAIVYLGG